MPIQGDQRGGGASYAAVVFSLPCCTARRIAPTARPAMPTPKPIVEMVAFEPRESMSDCALAGQILFAHSLSSVDFEPSATTPKTVPTRSPAPPTANAAMAGTRLGAFGPGVGWTDVVAPVDAAAVAVSPGGGGAAATAVGSTSSFSDTIDSAPSRTFT